MKIVVVVRIVALWISSAGIVRGDHVDDVITAQMRERKIPGVALAVIHGGKIVREQGYGYCDQTQIGRITPETIVSGRFGQQTGCGAGRATFGRARPDIARRRH